MAIELEKIKSWDGQSGTGADNRGVIDRNFDKVKAELEENKTEIVQLAGVLGIIDITGIVGTGFFVASTNGTLIASGNSTYVDYIPVSGLKKIYYTGRPYSGSGVIAYDANKNYLTALRSGTTETDYKREVEIPENAYYIRASSRESEVVVSIMADSVDISSYSYLNAIYNEPGKRLITDEEGDELDKIPVLETRFNDLILSQFEIKNTYNGVDSGTRLDKTYNIDAIGDWFEIDIEIVHKPDGPSGLSMIGNNASLQNTFGFHSTYGLGIRGTSGGFMYFDYSFQPGRHTYRIDVTPGGWLLKVDGVSITTVEKLAPILLRDVANGYTTTYHLECNIYNLKINSATDGALNVYDMNILDSTNVGVEYIPVSGIEHLPPIVVDYKISGSNGRQQFDVYCRLSGTKYYGRFRIEHALNMDENVYSDYFRIINAYLYERVADEFIPTNKLLLQIGESEFTMKSPNWVDHTGGAHGDEIKQTAHFFIDGAELSPEELGHDFIRECTEFSYLQNSTLHETAHRGDEMTSVPATGAGVLAIVNNKYQIDGLDTGVFAYGISGFATSITSESIVNESGMWKLVGIIVPNPEHPVVAIHDKLTVFSEKGYNTRNKVKFTAPIYVYAWVGLVCVSVDCSETIKSDDFDYMHLDRSGQRRIDRVGKLKEVIYNSRTNGLSAHVISEFLNSETDDAECNLHVLDSNTYAKYYRRTKYSNTTVGEEWIMVCDVRFSKP